MHMSLHTTGCICVVYHTMRACAHVQHARAASQLDLVVCRLSLKFDMWAGLFHGISMCTNGFFHLCSCICAVVNALMFNINKAPVWPLDSMAISVVLLEVACCLRAPCPPRVGHWRGSSKCYSTPVILNSIWFDKRVSDDLGAIWEAAELNIPDTLAAW